MALNECTLLLCYVRERRRFICNVPFILRPLRMHGDDGDDDGDDCADDDDSKATPTTRGCIGACTGAQHTRLSTYTHLHSVLGYMRTYRIDLYTHQSTHIVLTVHVYNRTYVYLSHRNLHVYTDSFIHLLFMLVIARTRGGHTIAVAVAVPPTAIAHVS